MPRPVITSINRNVNGSTHVNPMRMLTIGAATGFELIKFTAAELLCPWIRLVIVNNSESAATATVTYFFKGDR